MYKEVGYDTKGICILVSYMCGHYLINDSEYEMLLRYIENNRPSIFNSWDTFKNRNSDYYWPRYKIKPRLKWLDKHIKLLEGIDYI